MKHNGALKNFEKFVIKLRTLKVSNTLNIKFKCIKITHK